MGEWGSVMTARYTPVEIISGGIRDARETFAELYGILGELRREAASYYHRAFVDDREPVFHPAPPGFGGNELERNPRRVDLSRLTNAGLALYAHGVRMALAERDELHRQIEAAEHDLERMLIAMDGTVAHVVSRSLRHALTLDHRTKNEHQPVPLQPWDVPVRRPGTDEYLAPGERS